jgi:hypothetical protein
MCRSIHLMLVLVLMCRIGIAKAPSKHSAGFLRLNVLLFSYAPACSPETRNSAQAIANRIFHRAGIRVRWIDCSLLGDGAFASQACTQPFEQSAVILRLVPTSPATRLQFGADALGIAAQPEKETYASASVFHNRVEQLARSWLVSLAVVLGHAMAHEIGHLLLGTGSHSPSGLMKERWSRRDLTRAAEGNLLFSSQQAQTIRAQVLKGWVAAASPPIVTQPVLPLELDGSGFVLRIRSATSTQTQTL